LQRNWDWKNYDKESIPLLYNIFRFENTANSALYTYEVDVCFLAALAANSALYTYEVDVCFLAALAGKIAFPWVYFYLTGKSCEYLYI